MASKGFAGGSHIEAWKLDPNKVRPGINLRHDLGDIEPLAREIAAKGQHTPGLVRRDSEGHAVVVAGYRRLAACRAINADPEKYGVQLSRDKDGEVVPFPFKAMFQPMSDEQALEYNLSENVDRKDLTPVDKAHAAVRLEGFGWSRTRIAAALRVAPGRVAQFVSLLELPSEVVAMVHSGAMTEAAARAFIGAPVAQVEALAAEVSRGEIKPREAVARVVETKRQGGAKVGRALKEVKSALVDIGSTPANVLLRWIEGDPTITIEHIEAILPDTDTMAVAV